MMSQGFKRGTKQLEAPAQTTVFHAWPYGKFIEIQSNPSRKKLHTMNQGPNFLGDSVNNRDTAGAPIQF